MNWQEILLVLASGVFPTIIAIANICSNTKAAKNERTYNNKKRQIDDIKHGLEVFYYPYLVLAQKNTSLYGAFSKKRKQKDSEFSTLSYLISGGIFDDDEKALLDLIIENDIELRDLIIINAKLVDDSKTRENLVKLATHYYMIELAYRGKLKGDPSLYEEYAYPESVYGNVCAVVEKLENELRVLESENSSK